MLTSGLHRMLKIFIEIFIQVFHDNNFFSAFSFFFFFFDLIDFGLYNIDLLASYCVF